MNARSAIASGPLRSTLFLPPRQIALLVAIGVGQAAAVATAAVAASALAGGRLLGLQGSLTPAVALGIAAVAGAALRWRERIEAEALGQRVVHRIRLRMFRHLLRIAPEFLRYRRRGAAIVRFVGDLQAIRRWVSLGLARLAVSGATVLACLLVLAIANGALALAVAAVVLIMAVGMIALAGPIAAANRLLRRRRGQLANLVTEQVAAVEITRLHGRQRGEKRRLARRSGRLADALVARAGLLGRLDAITYLATALITVAAMRFWSTGAYAGSAAAPMVATLVVLALLSPSLRDLARVFEYWQAASVARERLAAFFDWPVQRRPRDAAPLREPGAAIEYEGVWLSERVPAFSARIEPGERVALIGDNGVGKSMLLALTAGLLDPRQGTIRIGGQRLTEVDLASLHRAIAFVSADLPLVRGSLRRNLLYGRRAATAGELERVIDLCALGPLIGGLEQGLDTAIAEGGRNLSEGERQRIALARALVSRPSLLLLDEVEAHLDEQSRKVLLDVIRGFPGAIIAATHDASLFGAFDRYIELDRGTAAAACAESPAAGSWAALA